jgi:hypothetical protein
MYHVRQDTLAFHRQRPLFQKVKMAGTPTPVVVQAMNAYMTGPVGANSVSPDEAAIRFYFLNHAYAHIAQKMDPDEPLGELNGIVNQYVLEASAQAQRLMYYVLLIITREARHAHKGAKIEEVYEKFGTVFGDYMQGICGMSESAAPNTLKKSPPNLIVGHYARGIAEMFYKGSWSGGFGGKPWGDIATTLVRLLEGETSPEMFIDTAWTLAHNNGPMFNKGMLYLHYDMATIMKILDVQRVGKIPQLLKETKEGAYAKLGGHVNWPALEHLYDQVVAQIPAIAEGLVDWNQVVAQQPEHGTKQSYSTEKKQQQMKYGVVTPATTKSGQKILSRVYVTEHEYADVIERKAA